MGTRKHRDPGTRGHGDTGIGTGQCSLQLVQGTSTGHRDQGLGTAVEHWDSALSAGAESEFWVLGMDAGFYGLVRDSGLGTGEQL